MLTKCEQGEFGCVRVNVGGRYRYTVKNLYLKKQGGMSGITMPRQRNGIVSNVDFVDCDIHPDCGDIRFVDCTFTNCDGEDYCRDRQCSFGFFCECNPESHSATTNPDYRITTDLRVFSCAESKSAWFHAWLKSALPAGLVYLVTRWLSVC